MMVLCFPLCLHIVWQLFVLCLTTIYFVARFAYYPWRCYQCVTHLRSSACFALSPFHFSCWSSSDANKYAFCMASHNHQKKITTLHYYHITHEQPRNGENEKGKPLRRLLRKCMLHKSAVYLTNYLLSIVTLMYKYIYADELNRASPHVFYLKCHSLVFRLFQS